MQTPMIGTPPAHRIRATKLLVAGCLLLGAGFLIKLDMTGMIGTNVISRVSRMSAPVMQYAQTAPYGTWRDRSSGVGGRTAVDRRYDRRNRYGYEYDQQPYNQRGYGQFGPEGYGPDGYGPDGYGAYGYGPNGRGTAQYGQVGGPNGRGTAQYGQVGGPYGRGTAQYGQVGGPYGRGPSGGVATPQVEIQGESLRTWAFQDPFIEQVQVDLSTIGRPLNATLEVWNGAGNTPVKIRAYSDDGEARPFSAVLATTRGPSTVAVRNTGQVTFPIGAYVDYQYVERPSPEHQSAAQEVQGAALRTYSMEPGVEAVEVVLETDGRPLNARIEILQGPGSIKQVVEVYTEDGLDRPFFCTFATSFNEGNVVKITNNGPVEFPLTASVVPAAPRGRYLQNREPSLD